MKSIYCIAALLLFGTIACAKEQKSKKGPKLSLGLSYLHATGNAAKNHSWGYGATGTLTQKISSRFNASLAATYSVLLGKSYIFADDTGNRRVRDRNMLPVTALAGAAYQCNSLLFCGVSAGYGFNTDGFRLTKKGSLAYALTAGSVIPKTSSRLAGIIAYNSLPAIHISYIKLGVSYTL